MRAVTLRDPGEFAEWREAARGLLRDGVPPEAVSWQGVRLEAAQGDLLAAPAAHAEPPVARPVTAVPRVPKAFVDLAESVIAHADPQRHARLYRLLWRIAHGERALLALVTDDDVAWALNAAKAVHREMHKMKAFVRFRAIGQEPDAAYIAWFEPEHDVLRRVAPFFTRRFAAMRWSILTPTRSAHWDGIRLRFGAGARREDAPADDAGEELWRVYYANIFNPARLKVDAMVREMPRRYWKNLPEAAVIPELVRDANTRLHAMVSAAPTTPRKAIRAPSLHWQAARDSDGLRGELAACRACALWQAATQAVPGEGPPDARVILVGEQPGDQEDLAGRPFVGPAGQLLDRALAAAGLPRAQLYLTNAVKHFKYVPRGKLRLHARASTSEQRACRPWLQREIAERRPDFIVALGSTAATALLGDGTTLRAVRGQWLDGLDGIPVLATAHPSALRRLPRAEQAAAFDAFVADLQAAARRFAELSPVAAPARDHDTPLR